MPWVSVQSQYIPGIEGWGRGSLERKREMLVWALAKRRMCSVPDGYPS
jgi:hypothetical protein